MKYKNGFIIGVAIGLFISLFVSVVYSYLDCFSCGFLGIDYCRDYGGICPIAGGFMNFVMFVSFPFVAFGLFISQFFSFSFGLPKFFALLTPLYLTYFGFLGFFLQKIFSNSEK